MDEHALATPWIGANFWSRSGGPRMWTRYDASLVREELAVLAEHGCTVTRSFFYWPDFVPRPGQLDEGLVGRFSDFLDAHRALDLKTIPTFLVGHMSGENWDPSWRAGRDLYRDVGLVAEEAWFAAEMARRFCGDAAVAGWLVSNEMPLYGGLATSEEITAWARLLVQAIRSAGARQPVSLGDGAWGIEVSGRDNGYCLRSLSRLVDFLGPHVYPMEDDQLRELLAAAFACELASSFGLPVVLEEFGVSSDFASDENAADYYRQVLHSTLLAGASGWIAWNNGDYDDLYREDPYRHHVFEMHFGLTDRRGRPKPQLAELARFSRLVRELAPAGFGKPRSDVALVVPEHFERVLPFTDDVFRQDCRKALFQSYVAAREADLPLSCVRERDGLGSGARLFLVPSTKLLTGPGLVRLRELAEAGATVYLSYFAGSTGNQRGPWLTWLGELFGVRHLLRYGLVDPIEDDEVVFRMVEQLGDLTPGTLLRFPVAGGDSVRSYLPVDPLDAKVLAVDGNGRPALLGHQLGSGSGVLCTYPLEQLAASRPRANPEDTWRLYSALACAAGVSRPVRVEDPRVLVGRLSVGAGAGGAGGSERGGAGGSERVVVANSCAEPVEARLLVEDGIDLVDSETRPASGLVLAPMAVEVLELRRSC